MLYMVRTGYKFGICYISGGTPGARGGLPGSWEKAMELKSNLNAASFPFLRGGQDPKHTIRMLVSSLFSTEEAYIPPSNVFLYPSGTKAIYDVCRTLRTSFAVKVPVSFSRFQKRNTDVPLKYTVAFGVNIDTFNTLTVTGNGIHPMDHTKYFEQGSEEELDEFETQLKTWEQGSHEHQLKDGELGNKCLALFCEFPGTKMLSSPNMKRIRDLANRYGFIVVCDDTLGTSVNIDVLPCADIIVTSLTKLFSGQCNVMGGT